MEFGLVVLSWQRGCHQSSRQAVAGGAQGPAAGFGARNDLRGRPRSPLTRTLLCLVVATMLTLQAGAAGAQTAAESWPNRAITWVVPFGAGGVTDLVSRKIAELLRTRLGQPVVVENRPGAGGTIGTEFVARAQADGYTVLYASGGPMTIQPNLGMTKLNYDPLKSYVHIRGVSSANQILVATAAAPYSTLAEFVAYAKAHPGKVNFGSPGPGTAQHLAGEMFQAAAGIKLTHVPYKSGSSQMTDMMSGILDVSFDYLAVLRPLIDTGKVKVLGTTGTARLAALPDAPTVLEAGYPDAVSVGSTWVSVPAGTDPRIVDRLSEALTAVLADPGIVADLASNGQVSIADKGPAEMGPFIVAETARYKRVIESAGIAAH
ncbi:Bug family tripartite tricarboxylate transporter substrate binding protein [Bradyrhizobium nitroreducens]|nr:tripartite tricarboxylate transporter substrate binding protein [Bradyrhizobium nitroreducens]